MVGPYHSACCACGAASDAAAGFDVLSDDDFEADGPAELFEHGDEGGSGGILGGVRRKREAVFAGDDDAGLIEEPDFHGIERFVELFFFKQKTAYEIGYGGGALY